jgi:hypothetical protein
MTIINYGKLRFCVDYFARLHAILLEPLHAAAQMIAAGCLKGSVVLLWGQFAERVRGHYTSYVEAPIYFDAIGSMDFVCIYRYLHMPLLPFSSHHSTVTIHSSPMAHLS